MAIDHSQKYRSWRPRNLVHRWRLRTLRRILRQEVQHPPAEYADFGCANGYLTREVAEWVGAGRAFGFDLRYWNVNKARRSWSDISFSEANLNQELKLGRRFDLITCLETIEHVGSPRMAIRNLIGHLDSDGLLIVSMPVEVGPVGVMKFVLKNGLFGSGFHQVSTRTSVRWKYLLDLVTGKPIGKYRHGRESWGTHFGFDYRDALTHLEDAGANMKVVKSLTTCFCIVRLGRAGRIEHREAATEIELTE